MGSLKIKYSEVLDVLGKNNLLDEHNIDNIDNYIDFISHDSRNIKENTLFFCKGNYFKEEYLPDAVEKGAVCYLSEKKYNFDCNYIITKNILRSIALIAPLYYNYPYKNLELTGITGTKGKTTTACFIRNILDEFTKSKTAFSNNIEKYTGMRSEESHINTPEPCDLQLYFHEAKESGIKYFTMEVSSQAYKRDRVYNITFDNGIFLNISEDHIGPLEHEDFEDYLNCKLEFVKNCSNIVINGETDCFERVLEAAKNSPALKKINIYGGEKIKDMCDYYYSDIKRDRNLTHFFVRSDKYNYSHKFTIKIPGLFNIENAAAAIVLCKTMGVDDESIRAGLFATSVPGRMNIIDNGDVTVIVDYAHNFLSFTKLYESLKFDYEGRKIISVGGAPGGKAFRRRKDFAEIAGKGSDYIYLTAEDPQYEDVVKICEEIAGYMPENTPREIIPDRGEAVEKAVKDAKPGDVIVLLAKGDENYQKVNGRWEFYESDLKIAQRALAQKEPVKYNKNKNRKAERV
ncbi:MAG: UDP-N-acetylmuramyl-tripeptide synthetase [Oscillospiraceae bacterium]|nr:UDP-N-acetylmuramyl-tripeptide synthetase [Oscillospiraceae bacterium]